MIRKYCRARMRLTVEIFDQMQLEFDIVRTSEVVTFRVSSVGRSHKPRLLAKKKTAHLAKYRLQVPSQVIELTNYLVSVSS